MSLFVYVEVGLECLFFDFYLGYQQDLKYDLGQIFVFKLVLIFSGCMIGKRYVSVQCFRLFFCGDEDDGIIMGYMLLCEG